jgi:probable HAF family extracellular repeat protein
MIFGMRDPAGGRASIAGFAIAMVFALSWQAAHAAPMFVPLGDLPGGDFASYAADVSEDGMVVVGYSPSTAGGQAFLWTLRGGMVGLGDLPGDGFRSSASGVSADGSVVVGTAFSASGEEAFVWTPATGMVGLGDFPGGVFMSSASGVSADGTVVVGTGNTASSYEAFRWTAQSGMVGLSDLPGGIDLSTANGVSADGAVVVGSGVSGSGVEAFRWTADAGMSGLGELPGGYFNSQASGASADGSVIVGHSISATISALDIEAFRWTAEGGMVGLGFPPGGRASYAWDVSADGQIAVGGAESATGIDAFVWDEARGMRSVRNELIGLGLDMTGWALTDATAVVSDGATITIVGNGTNELGKPEAWLAQIPEPSTRWLFAASLGGLWALQRRSASSR